MKCLSRALPLGLLLEAVHAQTVTETIRINTGSCGPASTSTVVPGGPNGPGGGPLGPGMGPSSDTYATDEIQNCV